MVRIFTDSKSVIVAPKPADVLMPAFLSEGFLECAGGFPHGNVPDTVNFVNWVRFSEDIGNLGDTMLAKPLLEGNLDRVALEERQADLKAYRVVVQPD